MTKVTITVTDNDADTDAALFDFSYNEEEVAALDQLGLHPSSVYFALAIKYLTETGQLNDFILPAIDYYIGTETNDSNT
jgi:hypothetical protein